MKKILLSLGVIAIVAAISISATGAFFSDTETSTANVFTAGAIDLKIDSQQHYNNAICVNGVWALEQDASETIPQYPVIGSACGGTWGQDGNGLDIVGEKFFSFNDIKPGDSGENTISLHVINNDAWLCAAVSNLSSDENSLTGPEVKINDTNAKGELDEEMVWTIWKDDGDNIMNNDEVPLLSGQPVNGVLALYDSTTGAPLTGATTTYLGVKWGLPSTSGNITQTDSLTGDISFYTVQSRNNGQFKCSDWGQSQEPEIVWTENGTQDGGDVAFVEDANAPLGSKVLQLTTADDVNSRVRYNHAEDVKLSTISGFSYDSKQISAFDPINGNASFRLVIDFLDDGTLVKDVTFEPYYNIAAYDSLNDASITNGTWQNWAATLADGTFWVNGVLINGNNSSGGGGYPPVNFTLNQLLAEYPNAKVVGISIGMGTYNKDQVVLVDNLIFNGIVHDFEN
ncbi:MAG: SipW-dependent-type signal peptide-containing protein [Candidatus Paceibacterota bacterium]